MTLSCGSNPFSDEYAKTKAVIIVKINLPLKSFVKSISFPFLHGQPLALCFVPIVQFTVWQLDYFFLFLKLFLHEFVCLCIYLICPLLFCYIFLEVYDILLDFANFACNNLRYFWPPGKVHKADYPVPNYPNGHNNCGNRSDDCFWLFIPFLFHQSHRLPSCQVTSTS